MCKNAKSASFSVTERYAFLWYLLQFKSFNRLRIVLKFEKKSAFVEHFFWSNYNERTFKGKNITPNKLVLSTMEGLFPC